LSFSLEYYSLKTHNNSGKYERTKLVPFLSTHYVYMYNRRVVCCVAKIYDLSVFLNKRSIGKKLRIALERKINFHGLFVKAIFWKLKQNCWMHQSI
jgi:hypothetical protein